MKSFLTSVVPLGFSFTLFHLSSFCCGWDEDVRPLYLLLLVLGSRELMERKVRHVGGSIATAPPWPYCFGGLYLGWN